MRSLLLLVAAWVGAAEQSRLVLQLGMLLALVYVAFLCAWLSRTRRTPEVGQTRRRVRAARTALAGSARVLARALTRRDAAAREGADRPWTCEIVWKRGPVWSRFQAVIVTSHDRERRVVAESAGLRWPPKDVRNPPTRELEHKLEGLVASIVATGWEPVASSGSWSERRFVWRRPGEPPTKLRPRRRRSTGRAELPPRRGASGSHALKLTRRAAARLDRGGSSYAS